MLGASSSAVVVAAAIGYFSDPSVVALERRGAWERRESAGALYFALFVALMSAVSSFDTRVLALCQRGHRAVTTIKVVPRSRFNPHQLVHAPRSCTIKIAGRLGGQHRNRSRHQRTRDRDR